MAHSLRFRNILTCAAAAAALAAGGAVATPVLQDRNADPALPSTINELRAHCLTLGVAIPVAGSVNLEALAAAQTAEDIWRLCASLGPDPLIVFGEGDKNQDGRLSQEEVIGMPLAFQALAVDRNGSGTVELDEYLGSIDFEFAGTSVDSAMVVGSLIPGASERQSLPVEVVGRPDLETRGRPSTESYVRELSEIGNVQTQSARGSNADGYGPESINLRNLGSGRTLVTLQGRRLADAPVASGANQNANSVPPSVIQPRAAPPPLMAPSVPGTEQYPAERPNAIKLVADEPVSTFSIDVDTAAYANVRRFLREGRRPPSDAVRVEELINYFDYGYAEPESRETPFRPFVAVAPSPWNDGKQIVHIGVQGYSQAANERPPLNLVFLVDTSGSMSSDDKLGLAQRSLNVLVDQLQPQDSVSLVAYAGNAGVVLEPTSGADKHRIRTAVDRLRSGGSTAGGAGLSLAYAMAAKNFDEDAVNRVILMTDGDFNVGVTDNQSLEDYVSDRRDSGVYLSVYGFGRGNYQDARMQVLAQNGNGTAAYVDTLEESRRLFRDDFSGSMFTIADDVKIQVEFNPAVVSEYRLIGYETRMLRREDFNNDAVDAGEIGSGVEVTALYEVTPVGGRRSIDPLRYGAPEAPAASGSGEMAFLKIRYKLPGEDTSSLMEIPIDARAQYASIESAPEATRWAAAVAAYGQKLRGDGYVPDAFTWDATINLAQSARGSDEFGLRAEFIQLVRAARELQQRNAGL